MQLKEIQVHTVNVVSTQDGIDRVYWHQHKDSLLRYRRIYRASHVDEMLFKNQLPLID